MPASTYAELNDQIRQHFANSEYQQVVSLATEGVQQFTDQRPTLDYWRMCAAARLNELREVYSVIEDSLANGFWYSESILRQSPSLQPLTGIAEFERLVETSRQRQNAESSGAAFRLLAPEDHPKPSLLLALHGNQSTTEATQPFWQPAVGQGWLVALPQSAQVMWKGAYYWNEHEVARDDVLKPFADLRETTNFNPNQIVAGGHSMGGEIAIWLALTNNLPVRGFVVIGPGGPFLDEPEQWQPIIAANQRHHLRGYFIVGSSDNLILVDKIRQVAEMLNANGLACEVEEVPGATHDYTPDYDPALLRGLAFVTNAK